ncbi:hypothetical protein HDA42_001608 [Streptomyces costaricanus]|uniref:Uncharacterized protein n=1 Tax=Streptomyces murinus TaxID=33900 RepID=A0A7W3NKY2_STRMR|nr:hypothetical protein [Streptomyces murinus]
MSKLIAAYAVAGGKVDGRVGETALYARPL